MSSKTEIIRANLFGTQADKHSMNQHKIKQEIDGERRVFSQNKLDKRETRKLRLEERERKRLFQTIEEVIVDFNLIL